MKDEYIALIDDTKRELDEIRKWINNGKNKFDSKMKYLISYSVIKSSGSIEVIFKGMVYDYLSCGANMEAKQYMMKMVLDSSCNPNTGNISNMLQNLSGEWKEKFDVDVKSSGCKDKLNSLVQLRNDFAHGANINVSIDTVITYFNSAVEILKILENTMKPE